MSPGNVNRRVEHPGKRRMADLQPVIRGKEERRHAECWNVRVCPRAEL